MSDISRVLRFHVLTRDGFRCQYCGRSAAIDEVGLEVDHIVSVKDGGNTAEINLITACSDCNSGKQKRSMLKANRQVPMFIALSGKSYLKEATKKVTFKPDKPPKPAKLPKQASAYIPPTGKRADVLRLRQANPCWHGAKIAEKVGLSRERVRQILKQAAAPTKRFLPQYQCLNCGVIFTPPHPLRTIGGFCSSACRRAHTYITLICEVCGNSFKRRAALYIGEVNRPHSITGHPYDHIYCSKRCHGVWLGKHHKPGVRPLKAECLRGHPLTGDNLYIRTDGHRVCRTCNRLRHRVRRAAHSKSPSPPAA